MSLDYSRTPSANLIATCQQILNELSRREATPKEKPSAKLARSSDDWVSLLMLPETKLELLQKYGHCETVSRSLVEFFFIEKNDFLPGDKHSESHGKHADGSQRMEPRWRRRLIKALRNGQEIPGFPLQKIEGTKDEFRLI